MNFRKFNIAQVYKFFVVFFPMKIVYTNRFSLSKTHNFHDKNFLSRQSQTIKARKVFPARGEKVFDVDFSAEADKCPLNNIQGLSDVENMSHSN